MFAHYPIPGRCRAGNGDRYLTRVVHYSLQLWAHRQKMSLQEAVKDCPVCLRLSVTGDTVCDTN